MTTEEKAKAYDEALERARAIHNEKQAQCYDIMAKVFPELAESEDERIRKEIKQFILDTIGEISVDDKENAWLTYLEKLKDIKLLSWRSVDECGDIPDGHYVVVAYNRPGFFALDTVVKGKLSHPRRGDIKATGVFYIPNADENCMCIIEKQKEPDYCHHEVDLSGCSEEYSKGYYDGWNNCNQQHSQLEAEQKPKQSEMEKEYVRTLHSLISDFLRGKQEIDREYYQKIWDWLDNRHIEQKPSEKSSMLKKLKEHLANTPREQLDAEFEALKDFAIDKPAEWSEEDEKDMAHIIRILDDCYAYGKHDLSKTDHENLVNKLKSLRPQPHWKPSEEQMNALKEAINLLGEHRCSDILDNLLCDLDSLKPSWRPNEKQMEALKYFVDQAKSKADAATTTWDKYENICALYNDLKKL